MEKLFKIFINTFSDKIAYYPSIWKNIIDMLKDENKPFEYKKFK